MLGICCLAFVREHLQCLDLASIDYLRSDQLSALLTLYGPYILESVVHDGFAFIKRVVFRISSMAIIGT